MAKANKVTWYGHAIRRDNDNILKKAMMMEVNGKRKLGRQKVTWRRQVEESLVKDRGSCRLNEMEGRCESDCVGD